MVTENILNDNSVQIRVDLATGNTDQVDRHLETITERTRTLEQRARTVVDTISRGQANIYVPGTYDRMVKEMKDVENFHKRMGIQSEKTVEKINYQTGAIAVSQKANSRDSQRQAQEQLSAIEKIRQEEEKRIHANKEIRKQVESSVGNYITSPGANVGAQERLQQENFTSARGGIRALYGQGLGIQTKQSDVQEKLTQYREIEPDAKARSDEFSTTDRTRAATSARKDYRELTKEIRQLEREAKRLDRELKQHSKTYQGVLKNFSDNFEDYNATVRGISTEDITSRFRDSETTEQYMAGEIDMDTLLESISTELARAQLGQDSNTTLQERSDIESARQGEEDSRQEGMRVQETLMRAHASEQEKIQREAAQRLNEVPDIIKKIFESNVQNMTESERGSYDAYEQAKGGVSNLDNQLESLGRANDFINQRINMIEEEASGIRSRLYDSQDYMPEQERNQLIQRLHSSMDPERFSLIQQQDDIIKKVRELENNKGNTRAIFERTFGNFQQRVQGETEDDWAVKARQQPEARQFAKGDIDKDTFTKWASDFFTTAPIQTTVPVEEPEEPSMFRRMREKIFGAPKDAGEKEKNTQEKALVGALQGTGMVAAGIGIAKFVEGIWQNSTLTRNIIDTYMKVFGHFADLITLSLLPLLIPMLRFMITTVRPMVKNISDWLKGDEDDNFFQSLLKMGARASLGFLLINAALRGIPFKLLLGATRLILGPAFGAFLKTTAGAAITSAGSKLISTSLGFIGPIFKSAILGAIPPLIALASVGLFPVVLKFLGDKFSWIESKLMEEDREEHHAGFYEAIEYTGAGKNVDKTLTYVLQEYAATRRNQLGEGGNATEAIQNDLAEITTHFREFLYAAEVGGLPHVKDKYEDDRSRSRAYRLWEQAISQTSGKVVAEPGLLKELINEGYQHSNELESIIPSNRQAPTEGLTVDESHARIIENYNKLGIGGDDYKYKEGDYMKLVNEPESYKEPELLTAGVSDKAAIDFVKSLLSGTQDNEDDNDDISNILLGDVKKQLGGNGSAIDGQGILSRLGKSAEITGPVNINVYNYDPSSTNTDDIVQFITSVDRRPEVALEYIFGG